MVEASDKSFPIVGADESKPLYKAGPFGWLDYNNDASSDTNM